MRQKKDKIIIVALSSLILFSSSIALMMYLKQSKIVQTKEPQVLVYVTKSEIKKGTLISGDDLQKKFFPKSVVSFSPPMPEEIIGKYTKVDFLAQEPYRAQKLTLKSEPKKQSNIVMRDEDNNSLSIANDSVSLSLGLFKNIDYSLKNGDYIDIVSVKENKKSGFKTTYIALHVKILSFSKEGDFQPSYQLFRTIKEKRERVIADTIVLDMPPRDIKNLLIAYYSSQEFNSKRVHSSKNNTGHLWMVKTKKEVDAKTQYAKNNLLLDKKVVYKRTATKRRAPQKVLISYEKE